MTLRSSSCHCGVRLVRFGLTVCVVWEESLVGRVYMRPSEEVCVFI